MSRIIISKEEVLRWVNLSRHARGLLGVGIYQDSDQFSTNLRQMLLAESLNPDRQDCAPSSATFRTKKDAKAVAKAWNEKRLVDEYTVRLPLELQVFVAEVNAGRWG